MIESTQVDSNEAREASKSRVTTQDTILASLAAAEPASEATTEGKTSEVKQEKSEDDKLKVKQAKQDRIQELANKRREAVIEAENAKRENEELRARIKALETSAPAVQPSDRPSRLNFSTEEQYLEALTDWKTDKRIAEREKQQREARLAAEVQEVEAHYMKTVANAKERYSDFNEVVSKAAHIAVQDSVVAAIKDSDIGGDITYYLAKHSDEAKKLLAMTPVKAVKYIDRLERDLLGLDDDDVVPEKAKPEAKRKAPEPITPVRGTSVIPNTPAKDYEEYRARRKAEMQRK